jgi:ubiquinol-cytochrome c reductase cytochrome c1 subunit
MKKLCLYPKVSARQCFPSQRIIEARMKKTLLILSLLASSLIGSAFATSENPPKKLDWPFGGMLGHVDKPAAQRGFQVYKEVCSACHGLKRLALRNLADIGFTEAEIKALASGYQINDGPNDQGEMFQRPGKPSDYFPPPYPNENASRAAFNGAYPPDLSLIIKARHDGANYVYSLLTGYSDPPADVHPAASQYYNPYFPGELLAMPPPLSDGRVEYTDGTQATVDQMTRDVVVFLQWAAEPEMESRKEMGLKVLVFLAIFTVFMYIAKRNIWRKLH